MAPRVLHGVKSTNFSWVLTAKKSPTKVDTLTTAYRGRLAAQDKVSSTR